MDGRLEKVVSLLSSHGFVVHTEIQRETERETEGDDQGGGDGGGASGGAHEGGLADVYVAFTPGAAQLYYVYATREGESAAEETG